MADNVEEGEHCTCGGKIDKLYRASWGMWFGRCFRCGKPYIVLRKLKEA